eukprot:403335120
MSVDSRISQAPNIFGTVGSSLPQRDFEKELNDLKIEYIKFLRESKELDQMFQKQLREANEKLEDSEKEKKFWQEKVEIAELEHDCQIQQMKQKHQGELESVRDIKQQELRELQLTHKKDKQFLEELIKQSQQRIENGNYDCQIFMEMENKYLRDIKDLNDSFDEYKAQVEKHIQQLQSEKTIIQKANDDFDLMVTKLKRTLRNNTNHHEMNSKRMRDKITKLENEQVQLQQDNTKNHNKIKLLKQHALRLEQNEKKLKLMLMNNRGDQSNSHVRSSAVFQSFNNGSLISNKSKNKSIDGSIGRVKPLIRKAMKNQEQNSVNDDAQTLNNCQTNITSNAYDSVWQTLNNNSNLNHREHQLKLVTLSQTRSPQFTVDNVDYPRNLTPQSRLEQLKFGKLNENFASNIVTAQTNFMPTNVNNSSNKNMASEINNDIHKHTMIVSELTSNNNSANKNLTKMIKMLKPINNLHPSPSQCDIIFTRDRILMHYENGVACHSSNVNKNSEKSKENQRYGSRETSLSKKKVNKRESIVFKNSFTQSLNSLAATAKKSQLNKEAIDQNGITDTRKFNLSNANLQEFVTHTIDVHTPKTNDFKSKYGQFQTQTIINDLRYQTDVPKNQNEELMKQELMILSKQNQQLQSQVETLLVQLEHLQHKCLQLDQQKQKNEGEMQSEIRFLLQQIIQLKDQFQNTQTISNQNISSNESYSKNPSQTLSNLVGQREDNNNQFNKQLYDLKISMLDGCQFSSGDSLLKDPKSLGDMNSFNQESIRESRNIQDQFSLGMQKQNKDNSNNNILASLSERNLIQILQEGRQGYEHQNESDKTFSTLSGQVSEQTTPHDIIHINSCSYTPSLHSRKNTCTNYQKIMMNTQDVRASQSQFNPLLTSHNVSQDRSQITLISARAGNNKKEFAITQKDL